MMQLIKQTNKQTNKSSTVLEQRPATIINMTELFAQKQHAAKLQNS
jgi:hypothetical protein